MYHHSNSTNNWTEVLTAIGTLLAVLTTVYFFFYEKIRYLYNRPKLKIGIKMNTPDCNKTKVGFGDKIYDAFWFRFYVKNEGKTTANDLEVIIEKVERKINGNWLTFSEFLPSNLVWTHINHADLKKLLPGVTKNVDFGYILEPSARLAIPGERNINHSINLSDNVFRVNISVPLYYAYNIIEPGEYLFNILVGASNSDVCRTQFILNFTKDWTDDESEMFIKTVKIQKK